MYVKSMEEILQWLVRIFSFVPHTTNILNKVSNCVSQILKSYRHPYVILGNIMQRQDLWATPLWYFDVPHSLINPYDIAQDAYAHQGLDRGVVISNIWWIPKLWSNHE